MREAKESVAEGRAEISGKSKKTVRGLQEDTGRFRREIAAHARKVKDYCEKMATSVKKFQGDILEQVKANEAAAKELESGVRKIHSNVKAMQGEIKASRTATKTFIKEFYG